ncbi:MAG: hypothetical protein IPM42_01795 [Saprospiraceae bacterium]|nr:hypothetical protein [Saprospiraceae bacterium]
MAKKLSNSPVLVQDASFINNDRSNLSVYLNHTNIYDKKPQSEFLPIPVFKDQNPIQLNAEYKKSEIEVVENVQSDNTIIVPGSKEQVYSAIDLSESHNPEIPVETQEYNSDSTRNIIEPAENNEIHTAENINSMSASTNDVTDSAEDLIKDKKKKKKRKKKKEQDKSSKFILNDFGNTSDYVQWLLSISGKSITKSKDKKTKKKKKVSAGVKRSITKSEQIISESLADILAAQGHFSEAIKMYDQLILKFPEKSSYFAAKIDNLLKIKE